MNITDEQGVRWLLLKAYEAGFRYITMDDGGEVFLFKNKPSKRTCDWYDGGSDLGSFPMCLCESFNPLVSWEDKEPLDIGKYLGIVDWGNVPVDTKVLVSHDGENWKKRHFKCYVPKNDEHKYVCFENGRTSWSDGYEYDEVGWRYCKLAEEK